VAATKAKLPSKLNADFVLRSYSSGPPIMDGAAEYEPQTPVLLLPDRSVTRTVRVAEFTQLPDFSFSLWDWATGNEQCPLDDDLQPQACHDYNAHHGPLNTSHFLPQARNFWAQYHALAIDRMEECGVLYDALAYDGNPARFRRELLACEKEAMVLEAVGQHFLQDAWSSGHMWERWGGPERSDYPSDSAAVLIGAFSGSIHGATALLQPMVEGWTGL
jgi:hypothetical protein